MRTLGSSENMPETEERGDAKEILNEIGKMFGKVNETTNLNQGKWR